MNDDMVRRALMGIRKGAGKNVRLLGHTNNTLKFLGKSYNTGNKISHTSESK